MTLDELIEEIKILKETYPGVGSLRLVRKSKKGNIKQLVAIEKKSITNGFFSTTGIMVEFDLIRNY
jgi:hypothetical protein